MRHISALHVLPYSAVLTTSLSTLALEGAVTLDGAVSGGGSFPTAEHDVLSIEYIPDPLSAASHRVSTGRTEGEGVREIGGGG